MNCIKCNKPGEFYKNRRTCKECVIIASNVWKASNLERVKCNQQTWRENNLAFYKEGQRNCILKAKYGISADDYDQMLKLQQDVCAICRTADSKRLAVDHDHSTGKIRKLLCSKCNTVLGMVKDNIELLLQMKDYLDAHNLL